MGLLSELPAFGQIAQATSSIKKTKCGNFERCLSKKWLYGQIMKLCVFTAMSVKGKMKDIFSNKCFLNEDDIMIK